MAEGQRAGCGKIGLLLGCGMVARFAGSLLIASQVKNPAQLIVALRLLALATCLFALGFWLGSQWLWLLLVMIGFNLFFSPLVPLSDALAATGHSKSGWPMVRYGCGARWRLLSARRLPVCWSAPVIAGDSAAAERRRAGDAVRHAAAATNPTAG